MLTLALYPGYLFFDSVAWVRGCVDIRTIEVIHSVLGGCVPGEGRWCQGAEGGGGGGEGVG